ncbi:flagellar M-ring protein [Ligilactobacillus salitolerans]|uniref:Flagellar M-ring protein n=1 Tax=Ligilactobacillus salitolerans TaxID=1808352 RepID=A0A401ITQ0_9LACO|nr:flagellar basal-body MS-ring/collar protein FliF [Ligilactobacillus salitolerans]GBG94933.1 flagellar M-ring protein [Ligilactobacillus salitolerans]
MNKVRDFFENLKDKWTNASRVVKVALVAGIISLVAAGGITYYLNTRVDYAVLFSNLSDADAGTITQDLEEQDIKYKLKDDGKTILVDKTKVDQYRIDMAVDNKLPDSTQGYELFDDTSMMTTDEDRKIMYQRATTGELERSIESLNAVKKAKVMLTMPDDDVFSDDSSAKKAKASVALTLNGTSISNSAVQGIVALTTGSVKGLTTDNVKVVDSNGNVLADGKNESDDLTGANSKYMQLQKQYEKQLEQKITKVLKPISGENAVSVAVNADLNFDAIERKTTKYTNPNIRSENVQANGKQADVEQAQTGETDDNVSNVTGSNNDDGASYSRTVNNELDTDVVKQVSAPGAVRRLTTSVVLKGDVAGDQQAQIKSIVRSAIGYNKDRGDKVTVQALAIENPTPKVKHVKTQKAGVPWWYIALPIAVIAIISLAAFLIIRKTRRDREDEEYYDDDYPVDVTDQASQASQELQPAPEEPEMPVEKLREKPEAKERHNKDRQAQDYAKDNPAVTAEMLKAWMKDH